MRLATSNPTYPCAFLTRVQVLGRRLESNLGLDSSDPYAFAFPAHPEVDYDAVTEPVEMVRNWPRRIDVAEWERVATNAARRMVSKLAAAARRAK